MKWLGQVGICPGESRSEAAEQAIVAGKYHDGRPVVPGRTAQEAHHLQSINIRQIDLNENKLRCALHIFLKRAQRGRPIGKFKAANLLAAQADLDDFAMQPGRVDNRHRLAYQSPHAAPSNPAFALEHHSK